MKKFTGRIGVIGAGAVGCYYGSLLARAGNDVHFLMRRDYEAVKAKGLFVNSYKGNFHIQLNVYFSASDMGPVDLVLIGLKTTHNSALVDLLKPIVKPTTVVLTLQNGLGNEEAISEAMRSVIPQEHCNGYNILGGIAFICCSREGRGVVNHTSCGNVKLGVFSGDPSLMSTVADDVADMFTDAGALCRVHSSVRHIRWHKLVWNIPFNGLGVGACHANTDDILRDSDLSSSARGLMMEIIEAARSEGVVLDESLVYDYMEGTAEMGKYKTSMQIDYEEKRPLEVESILGEPLRRARAAGVHTPRLELLYAIVKRINHRLLEECGHIGA